MNKLIEGVDYYIENGFFIMTEEFHQKRGFCCGNGCRHCPFDPKHIKHNTNLKPQEGKKNEKRLDI
jgi:hypothetical protein